MILCRDCPRFSEYTLKHAPEVFGNCEIIGYITCEEACAARKKALEEAEEKK